MSESAVKGDVYLPVLAGGYLPANPVNGAIAPNVRGCGALAVIAGALNIWNIVLERLDVTPDLCVVLIAVAGSELVPPYIPQYNWDAQGSLFITAYTSDGESGYQTTLEPAITFTVLHIPNR